MSLCLFLSFRVADFEEKKLGITNSAFGELWLRINKGNPVLQPFLFNFALIGTLSQSLSVCILSLRRFSSLGFLEYSLPRTQTWLTNMNTWNQLRCGVDLQDLLSYSSTKTTTEEEDEVKGGGHLAQKESNECGRTGTCV